MIEFAFDLARAEFHLQLAASLPQRGVVALFGRSGCGKTTLLRCIAGLEPNARGHLTVAGEVWQSAEQFLPPHQRALGYVFQEGRLFPHLSVRDNLLYGYRRIAPHQRQLNPTDIIDLLDLEALLQRRPDGLSGGQRQRVAIARALLTSPRLILMDEPLAALDDTSKADILPWLERLHRNLDIPVIYVSHALEEVARLADHMLLLEDGKLRAEGPIQQLLTDRDLPLAHSGNAAAILDTTVLSYDAHYHLLALAFAGYQLHIPCQGPPASPRLRIRLAARDIVVSLTAPQASSALNVLPVTVIDISPDTHPAHVLVRLALANTILLARITHQSQQRLGLAAGQSVYAQIKAVALS